MQVFTVLELPHFTPHLPHFWYGHTTNLLAGKNDSSLGEIFLNFQKNGEQEQ